MNKVLCYAALYCLGTACSGPPRTPAASPAASDTDSAWALLGFKKVDSLNPILGPGDGSFVCPMRKETVYWEQKDVFNPAVITKDGKVLMLYRAQDKIGKPSGTSRIGLAESDDGLHFTRRSAPVLYPAGDAEKKYEWEGGCEDPRVVQDSSGTYYMTYTAYDGTLARLMIATSRDLIHWTKQGPVFARAMGGKYLNKWSKSGAIVSRYTEGTILAVKLHGKYWMYWGDQNICAATSDDLIHWTPVEMEPRERPPIPLIGQAATMPELKIVVPTRQKKFDSYLVESGPPALLTGSGILLIYNGSNDPRAGDPLLARGTYAGGEVLLDQNHPTRVLRRLDHYFIKPDKPYEMTGQVNNVCFLEGLVHFHQKWFLYYGTADSRIAVAVKE